MRPTQGAIGLLLWPAVCGRGCLKEAVVPVKEGGDESLVEVGGSGTGGRCDGVTASAQKWIREARESEKTGLELADSEW